MLRHLLGWLDRRYGVPNAISWPSEALQALSREVEGLKAREAVREAEHAAQLDALRAISKRIDQRSRDEKKRALNGVYSGEFPPGEENPAFTIRGRR